ncbi:hypothetical protein BaRGS_00006548 [Batillaria attramentaria]|uniref:Uncharacterized protein n=1 Tax=Batillaria attramentaria TaxID=370345 RepID=A0ABD0LRK9_9CAEN
MLQTESVTVTRRVLLSSFRQTVASQSVSVGRRRSAGGKEGKLIAMGSLESRERQTADVLAACGLREWPKGSTSPSSACFLYHSMSVHTEHKPFALALSRRWI